MATFVWKAIALPTVPTGYLGLRMLTTSGRAVLVDTTGSSSTTARTYTSTDGITWSTTNNTITAAGSTARQGIGVVGSTFVFSANETAGVSHYTSADASSWTRTTSTQYASTTGAVRQAAENGSRLSDAPASVAQTTTHYSDNGTSWTLSGAVASAIYRYGAYGGGVWLWVASTGAVIRSTDGATWTAEGTLTGTTNSRGLAWNGSVFCSLRNGAATAYTSPSGLSGTWTTRTLPATGTWTSVVANGSTLFALSNTTKVYQSDDDGATWTTLELPNNAAYGGTWNGKTYFWSSSANKNVLSVGTLTTSTTSSGATSPTAATEIAAWSNGSAGWSTASMHTTSWTTMDKAYDGSNNVYASYTGSSAVSADGKTMVLSGFGFSVPSGAVLDAVMVNIEVNQITGSTPPGSVVLSMIKNVSLGTSSDLNTFYSNVTLNSRPTTGEAVRTVAPGSLLWSNSGSPVAISADDVNSSNFGIGVEFYGTSAFAACNVDNVQVTVYYTSAGGSKEVAFSVSQSAAYTAALNRIYRSIAGTVAETAVYSPSVNRARPIVTSVAETESITAALARTKNIATSVAETESISVPALKRTRNTAFNIAESESITSSVKRLRGLALTLAETVGYSFDLSKLGAAIKALAFSIAQTETHAAALKRTRAVVSVLSEVASYAATVKRSRTAAFSITEVEVITEALKRSRALVASLTEAATVSASAKRSRSLAAAIAETEALVITLTKIKLMSLVSNATQGSTMLLSRVRGSTFTIAEATSYALAMKRARGFIVTVPETEGVQVVLKRLRTSVLQINETSSTVAALNRLRAVLTSISEVTGYTFTVTTFGGQPTSLTITVTWSEFVASADGTLRLTPRSEVLTVTAKHSADLEVIQTMAGTTQVELISAGTSTIDIVQSGTARLQ